VTEEPITAHVFTGRYGDRREPSPKYCAAAVHDGGRSVGHHQCSRKPKVKRLVKVGDRAPKVYGFCSLHDPVVVQKKRKEKSEKFEREWAAKTASWERQEVIDLATRACVEAIRKIAAGHNDPASLARECVALFPEEVET
jgi:hypothetical protein